MTIGLACLLTTGLKQEMQNMFMSPRNAMKEKKGFVLSLLKHKASPEVKDDLASMTAHSLGFHLMGKLQLIF